MESQLHWILEITMPAYFLSLVSVSFFQGYFLLHRLASIVGLDEFDAFLFNYVQHFKEQLVASEVSWFYER